MIAVLIACLVAVPTECRRHEIILHEVQPVAQWMEAQTAAVEWLRNHPGMHMKGLQVLRGRAA